ncbi:MAG TPA: tetraacyldisaccharide 4'-kinase [Vicinamibacterales bacterium]|nr:tetraacyldisaccharide 4'-kinase [Vicinamibacterales bacterium]
MNLLSAAYGQLAQARRAWFTRRPHVRRRLPVPVVSVGNLSVGGSGKTPAVATLAKLLLAGGERPVILSRGYARREPVDGVLVVSDGRLVYEPVERSGDEPQLLARTLPGVPVLVCPDRYLAGMLAERRFGATVLLLDDGFQHLELERDIDLLLVRPEDVHDELLPKGRLREPLTAAQAAHAIIVPGSFGEAAPVAALLGKGPVFTLAQEFATPRLVRPFGDVVPQGAFGTSRRLVAVAGIARPERFFKTVETLGWEIARPMVFRDHHWFTRADVDTIHDTVQTLGSGGVITTEKDAVRLTSLALPHDITWTYVPMRAAIEPAREFKDWFTARLAEARQA